MTRQEEIAAITKKIDEDSLKLLTPLIDQVIFVEEQLEYLKTLPFLIVHPNDKSKQKPTPAYKQYKDLSQTYLNALKVLSSALGIEADLEESPLRKWFEAKTKDKLINDG